MLGNTDKRIRWTLFAFILVFGAVAARSAFLTTVNAQELSQRIDIQHVHDIVTPAHRGTIFDRDGKELAVGVEASTITANPQLIDDPLGVANQLAPILNTDPKDLLGKLSDRSTGFIYLARKIDPAAGDAVSKLIDQQQLQGIEVKAEEKRIYPQETVAAQVLGYAGMDNTGLAGIELQLDQTLSGTEGRQRVITAADGSEIETVSLQDGVRGTDVSLTIDEAIQYEAEKVLTDTVKQWNAKGAEAIVMNPKNGEIYAMVNVPTEDANKFDTEPEAVRRNHTVVDSYEPGSVFKAVTVSAGLEEGVVAPGQTYYLPPTLELGGATIKDAVDRGEVDWDLGQILVHSSNVGAVTVGRKVGPDKLYDWVNRFGFCQPTGIEFPGEEPGYMPAPADWSGSTIGNIPIGQGITVTALQMTEAYATIANNGVSVQPHLVRSTGGQDTEVPPGRQVIQPQTAKQLAQYLLQVVEDGGAPLAQVDGFHVAGKTGTAQKIDPDGSYSNENYIGSFAGFMPAADPQLVVMVMVDEPHPFGGGSTVAAPAFQKITQFALQKLRIAP